jgi:hypothetical protein
MQDLLPAGGLRLYREGVEPSGSLRKVSGYIPFSFPGLLLSQGGSTPNRPSPAPSKSWPMSRDTPIASLGVVNFSPCRTRTHRTTTPPGIIATNTRNSPVLPLQSAPSVSAGIWSSSKCSTPPNHDARSTTPHDARGRPLPPPMPSTDRLPPPSHRRTLLPNRPAALRALAVSRHQHRASPVHFPLSLLAPQSLHSRPLDDPRALSPVPFDPHSSRRRATV